eukprot:5619585-Prorocentrum_lima.AAC.1
MTSSLVGSEMCIRDSSMIFAVRCCTRSRTIRSVWLAGCAACTRRYNFPSVSYTHLTLPTICSV